jgi:hypothetical protein
MEAVMQRIADGGEYLSYAGSRGDEQDCRVFCFDDEMKARAMQTWIDTSGVATRRRPEPPPDYPQLKVG